jgi:RNA polymerase sigma-70 factor (ECF subfamily)
MAPKAGHAAGGRAGANPGATTSEPSGEEPTDEQEAAARREAVHAAIAELPDVFREVFVRVDLEEQAAADVARDLGIPVNTAYTRLHLARGRFIEALRRLLARRRLKPEDL